MANSESGAITMAGTFREYWDRIRSANGNLADHGVKITISSQSFEAQLRKAYQRGVQDQKQLTDEMRKSDPVSRLGDMFGFGE